MYLYLHHDSGISHFILDLDVNTYNMFQAISIPSDNIRKNTTK